MVPYLSIIQPI